MKAPGPKKRARRFIRASAGYFEVGGQLVGGPDIGETLDAEVEDARKFTEREFKKVRKAAILTAKLRLLAALHELGLPEAHCRGDMDTGIAHGFDLAIRAIEDMR